MAETFTKQNGVFGRSVGGYQGQPIYEGDQASIKAQVEAINAARNGTPITPPTTQGVGGATLPGMGGSTQPSGPAAAPDPLDSFNSLTLDLLKSAQGVGTADLLKRRRELQREGISRTSAPTPSNIRTLSPAQQAAIRSGSVSALSPEIDENAYEIEKAQQSIDNFFRVYGETQKMSKEFADKMVAPDSVIQNAKKLIEANPEAMSTVLAGFNDKSKQAILGQLDYNALKPKAEATSGVVVEAGGRTLLINPKTGATIRDLGEVPLTKEQQAEKDAAATGSAAALEYHNIADEILSDPDLSGVTGLYGQFNILPGTQLLRNKVDQLIAGIQLDERKKLKGQGTITDQEAATLAQSATSLSRNLPTEDFKTELKQVNGVFGLVGGLPMNAKVTDPRTGEVKTGQITRDEYNSALQGGYKVEFQ